MNRIHNLLAGGLLAGGAMLAAAPLAAQAANCPTHESYFGTIQRVQGNSVTVRANNGRWGTVMIDSGARMNTGGYALRAGTYIGAYGCVTPNGVFHASEITLARDPSAYNETVSGVVQRIESGRLVVSENTRHTTGYWYVPDTDDYHVGQTVTGSGMLASNGAFYPQSVNGRTLSADLDNGTQAAAVTMQGRVQRVESGRIIVWEPSRHTSGTWIVNNATAFRVGEHVRATGTEHNGYFYPTSIGPG